MATGWAKSLPCKSIATDDVARHHRRRRHHHHHNHDQEDHQALLSRSASKRDLPRPPSSQQKTTKDMMNHKKPSSLFLPLACGINTSQIKDVLLPQEDSKPRSSVDRPLFTQADAKPRSSLDRPSKSNPPEPSSLFPTLTELPAGHSSRRVVEIIFSSSWSRSGEPFPGEIEILFKVHNPARTVARFEEYRETVRSRAGAGDARCAADGNEMMRFHCAPAGPVSAPAGDPIYVAGVICSSSTGSGIRTFSGSGGAHDSSGGAHGFRRRRAMIVCRVIAGRVRTGSGEEFESVWVGRGEGELLVFEPKAVLPCFLIIYKV